jgi:hypothetical protein
VAIVLESFDSNYSGPRWYDGPTCTVLLVDELSELPGVLIPPRHSGPRNCEMVLPDDTTGEVLAAYRLAKAGGGEMPKLDEAGWGSRVVIGWVARVPVIDQYLTHPSSPRNRLPVARTEDAASKPRSIMDLMAEAARQWTPTASITIPADKINAQAVPPPRIPAAYVRDRVLRDIYVGAWTFGWLNGAERGYVDGVTGSTSEQEQYQYVNAETQAFASGTRDGYAAGYDYGKSIAAGRDPVSDAPTAPAPPPEQIESYDEASDVDSGHAVAAVPDGRARVLEYAGARVLIKSTGEVVIDSQNPDQPIRIQAASSAGVVISAGSSKIHVVNGVVSIGDGDATEHATKWESLKTYLTSLASWCNTQVYASTPTSPTPQPTDGPSAGNTKVN